MVESPGYCTNSPEVADFLSVSQNPKNVGTNSISDLYLEKGLTEAKIAEHIGLSKSEILRRLHSIGIRKETLKQMPLGTPRPVVRAPFGKQVVDGRLVDNRSELKTARRIVELRERQNFSWNEIVERLNRGGLRTRQGLQWKLGTTKMVFDRWNGKL